MSGNREWIIQCNVQSAVALTGIGRDRQNDAFSKILYQYKMPNLTYIFGSAETMIGKIHADVAVIVTRSGHKEMQAIGYKLADKVLDIYEMGYKNPLP